MYTTESTNMVNTSAVSNIIVCTTNVSTTTNIYITVRNSILSSNTISIIDIDIYIYIYIYIYI